MSRNALHMQKILIYNIIKNKKKNRKIITIIAIVFQNENLHEFFINFFYCWFKFEINRFIKNLDFVVIKIKRKNKEHSTL